MGMLDHRILNAHQPDVHFGPVGMCIYCGDTRGPLSNEHIIPDGLGGNLILDKASCEACARITGAAEAKVLRTMLGRVRGATGIRSKKSIKLKRELIDSEMFTLGEDVRSTDTLTVPKAIGLPFFFPMFITDGVPGILRGADLPPPRLGICQVEPPDFHERVVALTGPTQALGIHVDFDLGIMGQVFAKIAHAYAVAGLGMRGFEPLLKNHILNPPATLDLFLIAAMANLEPWFSLHDIRLTQVQVGDGDIYWLCVIRLFSFLRAPDVWVVVGRSIRPPPELGENLSSPGSIWHAGDRQR